MGIGFAIQIDGHAGAGAWVNGFACVCCFLIALLAFQQGERSITRSDWLSFTGALGALVWWRVTDDPILSVLLISLIDALGFYPTLRKSWARPYEETLSVYACGALGAFLSLFAMDSLSFQTAFYPAAMAVLQASFVILTLIRRRIVQNAP